MLEARGIVLIYPVAAGADTAEEKEVPRANSAPPPVLTPPIEFTVNWFMPDIPDKSKSERDRESEVLRYSLLL